jgi:predicted DNA-binding transcriptional regulator AlpA
MADPLKNLETLPDDALVGVRTVAAMLDCSPNTVWRSSKAGNIPAPIHIATRTVRWNLGELRVFINGGGS